MKECEKNCTPFQQSLVTAFHPSTFLVKKKPWCNYDSCYFIKMSEIERKHWANFKWLLVPFCYGNETVNWINNFLVLEPSILVELKACFSLCETNYGIACSLSHSSSSSSSKTLWSSGKCFWQFKQFNQFTSVCPFCRTLSE